MGDMTMVAAFYGGPADGALVVLLEPIPTVLRMPLDVKLCDHRFTEAAALNACQQPAEYRLELGDQGMPLRYLRNGKPTVKYLVRVDRKRTASA